MSATSDSRRSLTLTSSALLRRAFNVTNKVVPEMRKKVRSFLFSRALRYRVVIVDPRSAPAEAEGAPAGAEAGDSAA